MKNDVNKKFAQVFSVILTTTISLF